ncbi:MAG: acyltransferase [Muribaculum sp.]|nr:acyltransferase [Muribaculum sp.]
MLRWGGKALICKLIYAIGNKLRAFYNTGLRSSSFPVIMGEGSKISELAKIENKQAPKRIEAIKIGKGTQIDGILQVYPYGDGITIGDNSYVGPGTRIWAWDKIAIGNNVLISHNCNIIDSDSHEIDYVKRAGAFRNLMKSGFPENKGDVKTAPITIKDYAWISYGVSVLKGVTIGCGAIVGAGSVVTHDIPDFCMAAGNPAKVIKQIEH